MDEEDRPHGCWTTHQSRLRSLVGCKMMFTVGSSQRRARQLRQAEGSEPRRSDIVAVDLMIRSMQSKVQDVRSIFSVLSFNGPSMLFKELQLAVQIAQHPEFKMNY